MKKVFMLITGFLFFIINARSQSVENAKKDIYYGRLHSAQAILESVIAKSDAPSEAWYWLGEVLLKQKKITEAVTTLKQGIAVLPQDKNTQKNNPLIFIGLAHAYLDSGMVQIAQNTIDEILQLSRYKDAEILLAAAKANIDSKNGDTSLAITLLDKAIKRDKDNAILYSALGDAYKKAVDGGNAVVNYNKAMQLNHSFAEPMYKQGMIYKTHKDPEIFVDRFEAALEIDSMYTPAMYELYNYYSLVDVIKADKYLTQYLHNADAAPENNYMLTDLHYVSRKYDQAIADAKQIISIERSEAQPRLYKLIAYSYAAMGDSVAALENMNLYFEKQKASDLVSKDFELKAKLLENVDPDKALAIDWYKRALATDSTGTDSLNYMVSLAKLQNQLGNSKREAFWRENIYEKKENPTNLDVYNWGVALFTAEDYKKADSVFAIYQQKYPEQIHGYLWRAKANALIDTTMEMGLAIPHYQKVIEIASKDSVRNMALLLRAYRYLGAYEANITKDYAASLDYYNKILALNPGNEEAEKNAKILGKWIEDKKVNN